MNYNLLRDVLELLEQFQSSEDTKDTIDDFKKWIISNYKDDNTSSSIQWEGKEKGRSADSVINTLIVHMNRYAKLYSKSAIYGSPFSTQEDFIYLINLKAFGEMTKMELIKKNIHEKPVGMQIINRLIAQGWVNQSNSTTDKRSKVISITESGLMTLENQMDKIRQATEVVTGDLDENEKMQLIYLLNKLNDFHHPIYDKNLETTILLEEALKFKN